ncbi:hypothetical protein LTR53_009269 [Teratosphaeriaceae sp. CCFEE 6253]|nr:hypothetical protein LTR53_009269 [Teratosphaeriaceae sp. CCFEE 6253]
MAPFELLLLSMLVAGSASLPTTGPPPSHRGNAARWDVHTTSDARSAQYWTKQGVEYQCFDGDRPSSSDVTRWLNFDRLWRLNEPAILSSNRGDTYITHYIREAILQVAYDDGIDASLISAVMMQESSGRAAIPCRVQSNNKLPKCGLLQTTGGSSFDEDHAQASISRMIRGGVAGDGLKQALDGNARYMSDIANRLLGWDGGGEGYALCEN